MPWTTRESVTADVAEKVAEVRAKTAARRVSGQDGYQFGAIRDYASNAIVAGDALQREWFCDSICMVHIDGEKETYYLARSPDANKFMEFNVVHWTHWVGRLTAQIRDRLDGDLPYPESLEYGSPSMPSKFAVREIGPWVRYQFTNGKLAEYDLRDFGTKAEWSAEMDVLSAVGHSDAVPTRFAKYSFGLKDIIQLRDLAQDDKIRGPMAGVYIITRGPEVGKTSVALHRIPYLIMQQKEQLPAEMPSAPTDFFSVETMQVVVWRKHLVNYLRHCLENLRFGNIAVVHVADWIVETLRDYVTIGDGKNDYRVEKNESELLTVLKLGRTYPNGSRWAGLTEKLIVEYLTGRDGDIYHYPAAGEAAADLADLIAELNESLSSTSSQPWFQSLPVGFAPTVANVESTSNGLRTVLDRRYEEASDAIKQINNPPKNYPFSTGMRDASTYVKSRAAITAARSKVVKVRDRAVTRLTANYPAALAGFYASSVVAEAIAGTFGRGAANNFAAYTGEDISAKRLSSSDQYLLLWLVHSITRGGASTTLPSRPLIQYSHTVVDEAQYYHPLVLRLLVNLAKPPLRSMTIVGDLEQRVSSEGGLVGWDDVGIKAEAGKVFQLHTNYRWSEQVFEFLHAYQYFNSPAISRLKPPRKWPSGSGTKPVVVSCRDADHELVWLTQRLTEACAANWSIAVILPTTVGKSWRKQLVKALKNHGVAASWATGQAMQECHSKVIITDYENIVGLEFDAVFLPSCQKVMVPPTPDTSAIQTAWVALTRARQFVAVSHFGPIAVFDDASFKPYHTPAT